MLSLRVYAVFALVGSAAAAAAAGCGADLEAHPGEGGHVGTTTTSTTSTTSTTKPDDVKLVGRSCATDADCDTGICAKKEDDIPTFSAFWGEDVRAGGPAGGYCTRACETDDECPTDSRCGGGICLLVCSFGSPELSDFGDSLHGDKCWGRDDLMCVPTMSDDAVCVPNCGSDEACGLRRCDHRLGICVDEPREGMALGIGPCEQDNIATTDDEDACAGFCMRIVDDDDVPLSHLCTAPCSLGGDLAGSNDCGGPTVGACVYAPSFEDFGPSELGDYGYCTGACTRHDECLHSQGMFCSDLGTFAQVGNGYCLNAAPCPTGDECKAGELCTNTLAGPVCLDDDGNDQLLFPLGNAKPTGGAGGAGGA